MRQNTQRTLCWKTRTAKREIYGRRRKQRVESDIFPAVLRTILAGIVPDELSFDEFVAVDDELPTESENFELSTVAEQENGEEETEEMQMRKRRKRRLDKRLRVCAIGCSCICVRKAPARMS